MEWPNGVPSPDDMVLRHLRQANTIAAIAYGVQVGQAAINEVLAGGPKVLGEKPT